MLIESLTNRKGSRTANVTRNLHSSPDNRWTITLGEKRRLGSSLRERTAPNKSAAMFIARKWVGR